MEVLPLGREDAAVAGPSPEFTAALVAELPRLRRVARAVGGRGLHDDLLQETLVRACRSWRSFDPARPMGPWLRSVAVRAVAELDRRERRAAVAALRPEDAADPGSDDHVAALDRRRGVREALGALSPRDRTLLWRHEVEDLPYEVLAALTGATPVGTRKAVGRARDRLRVAYLAVVEGGRACLVSLAVAVARRRRRADARAGAVADRLLPLLPVSAAVVAAGMVTGVPAGLVGRAAADGTPAASAAAADAPSLVGTSSSVPATGAPPPPPAPPSASSPPRSPAEAAPLPPAVGLRAGPTGAGGGVDIRQPTPANDTRWWQEFDVRCDRSALLASTCAQLPAAPAGDGVEATVPTGPGP